MFVCILNIHIDKAISGNNSLVCHALVKSQPPCIHLTQQH